MLCRLLHFPSGLWDGSPWHLVSVFLVSRSQSASSWLCFRRTDHLIGLRHDKHLIGDASLCSIIPPDRTLAFRSEMLRQQQSAPRLQGQTTAELLYSWLLLHIYQDSCLTSGGNAAVIILQRKKSVCQSAVLSLWLPAPSPNKTLHLKIPSDENLNIDDKASLTLFQSTLMTSQKSSEYHRFTCLK